ncbi:hypothetical protein D3C85_705070 [compost metagenome]
MLGKNGVGSGRIAQAILRAPGLDALEPWRQARRLERLVAQFGAQRAHQRQAVAHQRHVHAHHLVDRRGIDIDMDLARMRTEFRELAGDAVVEARADADHQIRVVHGQVGLYRAVHAQHPHEPRVGRGEGAQAHQGQGAGRAGVADQVRERRAGVGAGIHQAAAAVEDGALGLGDQRRGPAHGRLGQLGRQLARLAARAQRGQLLLRGQTQAVVIGVARHGQLHVFRKIHQHGAGTALAGQFEGARHHASHIVDRADLGVPLGHRARDADGVAFLEGIGADGRRGHLPADAEHRDGIAHGVQQARRRVGHAGAGSHEHHARAARGAGVAFGRMHRGLFMPHQHVAQARFGVQRVVQGQDSAARIPENRIDTVRNQRVEQNLRPVFRRASSGG